MSKRIHNQDGKAHLPLFLFLLGTLAFSLSALPRGPASDREHFMETSLSSEFASDCLAMSRTMSGGSENGHCTINPVSNNNDSVQVRADISVTPRNDLGSRDANGNSVTSPGWATTVKILCEGDDCPEGIGQTITIPNHVKKKDFDSIYSTVMTDFKVGAKQMAKRIKAARAQAEKERQAEEERLKCEFSPKKNRRGKRHELKGIAQMNCFYANMEKMDDEEASDYYQRYVLGKLENLVSSQNLREQRQGLAMIKSLEMSKIGGEFIKESVLDLQKLGAFQAQANKEKMSLFGISPMDPTYQARLQQARLSQFQADMYFRSRGIQIENREWAIGDQFGFNYAENLLNNLHSFQNRLNQNYAAFVNQNQNIMNWNPQAQAQAQGLPNNYQPQVANNGPVQPWAQGTQFGPPPPPQQANNQFANVQNQPNQPNQPNQQPVAQQPIQPQNYSVPPSTQLQTNKTAPLTISRPGGIKRR